MKVYVWDCEARPVFAAAPAAPAAAAAPAAPAAAAVDRTSIGFVNHSVLQVVVVQVQLGRQMSPEVALLWLVWLV
jgi:hypothetical protein